MARKAKDAELKDRLKDYKAFAVEVDFIAYSVRICVLAADYPGAMARVEAAYPGLKYSFLYQLTAVIV